MSADLTFAYVAGVHPIAPVGASTLAQVDTHRRDLITRGERAWEVLQRTITPTIAIAGVMLDSLSMNC